MIILISALFFSSDILLAIGFLFGGQPIGGWKLFGLAFLANAIYIFTLTFLTVFKLLRIMPPEAKK